MSNSNIILNLIDELLNTHTHTYTHTHTHTHTRINTTENTNNINNINLDFQLNQNLLDNVIRFRHNLQSIQPPLSQSPQSPPSPPPPQPQYIHQPQPLHAHQRTPLQRHQNNTTNIFNNLINLFENYINIATEEIFDDLEDVKVTLTEDEFNKLNTTILDESILNNTQCTICLENLKLNEKLIILQCKHIFHRECIKYWLLNQSTKCPICRYEVRAL
jgi:hypothetical protein